MLDGSCCDSQEGYGHTVVTTNNGTFACNPWSEGSGYNHHGYSHPGGPSMAHAGRTACPRLQVLTSYESTSNSAEVSGRGCPVVGDDKPKMSRLEKKRIAAKRQRERKKCEITEANQKLALLEAKLMELQSANEALRLKSTVMETLVKTSDDHLRIVSLVSKVAASDCPSWRAIRAKGASPILSTPGLDIDLKDMSCAQLSCDDFRRLWNQIVSKGIALRSNSACQETLDQFTVDVMTWLENWSLVTDSATYLDVVSTDLENGTSVEPSCDHWCEVAKSLDLTHEQRQRALVGLQVVRDLLAGVISEQRIVCTHLDEFMCAACDIMMSNKQSVGVSGDEMLDKLSSALRRERFVSDLADAFLWKHVLSSQQKLAAALNSYPFFPDAIGILNGIHELSEKDNLSTGSSGASLSDSWSS